MKNLLLITMLLGFGWSQDCPENMFYSTCGEPFWCNPSCENPNGTEWCNLICWIGCFCSLGYVFSDDNYDTCILLEDCSESWCSGDLEPDCCGVCGGDNSQCSNCCGLPFNDDCTSDCYEDFNTGECCPIWDLDACGVCLGDGSSCDGTLLVPSEYSTIQEAIDAASDGDSVLVSAGTYVENITWAATNGIKLIGSSVDDCFIDGGGIDSLASVIRFEEDLGGIIDTTTLITGFTIQNGADANGGAIYTYNSSPNFNNLIIQNNGAGANGGAIYTYNSSPNFNNLIIQNNAAFNMGGGIYIDGGSQRFTNCKIYNNEIGDTNGGGMYCNNSENLYIDNCEFMYNHSPKNGGGIYLNNSQVEIKNTKIIENNEGIGGNNPMPTPMGGGIYASSSEVYLYNNVISSNNSYGPGGGIFGFESVFEIYHTEICNNTSLNFWQNAEGGGGCFFNSTVFFNQVTLSGNIAYSLSQYNSDGLSFKGSTSANIYNSIIYNNDDAEIRLDANASVTLNYTDIMGGILGISGPGSASAEYGMNNINEDPLFVDPENGDFTLQAGSPCIDAGDPNSELDPDGTIADMGAFYFDQIENPIIYGCMDSGATNYNPDATIDDGSCFYCNLGDVNCDGQLNILDIVLAANMVLAGEYDEIADVNEDGALDILDLVTLVNWVLFGDDSACVDIDGNVYLTVQLGEQVWMAENLKVTHYNDGSYISSGHSDEEWAQLETGAYAVYQDDPLIAGIYGNLYNWYAVDDDRGICPEGWHVPSDEEFIELEMFLGMSEAAANSMFWRGTDEGGKLKEAGLDHWNYYSDEITEEATNESGFTGLPAGHRFYNDGSYENMGNSGCFWSSSENNSANAWYRVLVYGYSNVNRIFSSKQFGFSIRCLRD